MFERTNKIMDKSLNIKKQESVIWMILQSCLDITALLSALSNLRIIFLFQVDLLSVQG